MITVLELGVLALVIWVLMQLQHKDDGLIRDARRTTRQTPPEED